MPPQLDRARIEAILGVLMSRLRGDWLLVGGGLVAIWLEPRRVTEDLDLIGLAGGNEQRWQLMELAESVGLPIEAVNSAAEYFVRRIDGWQDELTLLSESPTARLFRPTPTLFLLLKIARLSTQDLEDCRALLGSPEAGSLDRERVLAALAVLPSAEDPAVENHRNELRRWLGRPLHPA